MLLSALIKAVSYRLQSKKNSLKQQKKTALAPAGRHLGFFYRTYLYVFIIVHNLVISLSSIFLRQTFPKTVWPTTAFPEIQQFHPKSLASLHQGY